MALALALQWMTTSVVKIWSKSLEFMYMSLVFDFVNLNTQNSSTKTREIFWNFNGWFRIVTEHVINCYPGTHANERQCTDTPNVRMMKLIMIYLVQFQNVWFCAKWIYCERCLTTSIVRSTTEFCSFQMFRYDFRIR